MSTQIYSVRCKGVKPSLTVWVRNGMIIAVASQGKKVDFPPAQQERFNSANFSRVKLVS